MGKRGFLGSQTLPVIKKRNRGACKVRAWKQLKCCIIWEVPWYPRSSPLHRAADRRARAGTGSPSH